MSKSKINYVEIAILGFSFFVFLLVILKPSIYLGSVSKGILIWATVILPGLIPFMFLGKILAQNPYTFKSCFLLSKVTEKCFRCPSVTGYIYFMSILSGYPMGAKLIKDFREAGMLNDSECKKAVSFCSTSGPIFMIGSVGASLLGSYKAGVIIFCSHILASFICGLVFRGKKCIVTKSIFEGQKNSKDLLNDSMYSTIISSLIVGGFIAFTFLLIDIFYNLGVINFIGKALNYILFFGKLNAGSEVAAGLIEVTRGCLELSQTSFSLATKTIICSGLTAFGGLSVHLQSMVFLSSVNVKYGYFIKTKLAHTIFTVVLAYLLCLIFM